MSTLALNALNVPFFAIDGTGTIVFTNVRGDDELCSGIWLRRYAGKLLASAHVHERRQLEARLIGLRAREAFTLCVRSTKARAPAVMVGSCDMELLGPAKIGATAYLWLLGVAPSSHGAQLMSELYGLTAAEHRLLGHLACGASLNEAAISLAIQENTARVQLKSIFGKTRVRRQVDLLTLVDRLSLLRLTR